MNRRMDRGDADRRCTVENNIHELSRRNLSWVVSLTGIPAEPSNRQSRRDCTHECLCISVLTRLSDSLYNYSSRITIHSTVAVIYIHTYPLLRRSKTLHSVQRMYLCFSYDPQKEKNTTISFGSVKSLHVGTLYILRYVSVFRPSTGITHSPLTYLLLFLHWSMFTCECTCVSVVCLLVQCPCSQNTPICKLWTLLRTWVTSMCPFSHISCSKLLSCKAAWSLMFFKIFASFY
jgi:hypothetical protein